MQLHNGIHLLFTPEFNDAKKYFVCVRFLWFFKKQIYLGSYTGPVIMRKTSDIAIAVFK
jgi:hypothetical protein